MNTETENKYRDAQNYLLKPETAEFVAKFLCNYHVGKANSIWESGLTDRENRINQASDLLRGLINFINESKNEDKSIIDKIGLTSALIEAYAHADGHKDFLERTRNLLNAFIPNKEPNT